MLRKTTMRSYVRYFSRSRVARKGNEPKDIEDPKLREQRILEEFLKKPEFENPIFRTGKIFKRDFKFIGQKLKVYAGLQEAVRPDAIYQYFPHHTDVVIIGGGVTGASIAYWLSHRTRDGMHITLVDQTPPGEESALPYINQGNICHQQVIPEKVQMSLYGAEFLRNIHRTLKLDEFPEPDIQYEPVGSLYLADNDSAKFLAYNADVQNRLGVRNVLMSAENLMAKFPWLNVDGIALGCLGLSNEGRFNPAAMINAFKQNCGSMGVNFVEGRVIGFEFRHQPGVSVIGTDRYEQIERVLVLTPDGEVKPIKFGLCIMAAGASSGELASKARMGEGSGVLGVELPIEERKRAVHYFHCPNGPGLDTPQIYDSSGVFCQRIGFGGNYVASVVNDEEQGVDFDVIRSRLVNRIPAFAGLTLQETKVGTFECNEFDDNGIFGNHPYYHNVKIAAGFCGHSAQFAPAVGRAMMEFILDGEYKTINLSRFNFERLCLNEPLLDRPLQYLGQNEIKYVN